jgi:hypothetical protein
MKQIIIILLIVVLGYFLFMRYSEGFTPYGPYQIGNNQYQHGLGDAPAGVNATGGAEQQEENAHAASVDPVQPGNPQNVWADYKMQP